MGTNGKGNGHQQQEGETRHQAQTAQEMRALYQEEPQYLIIVPAESHGEVFEALQKFGHGGFEIYNMAVLRQQKEGLMTRLGTYAGDYIRAINGYLTAWEMRPLIDGSGVDHWTPQQMKELLTMSAYQFAFDWEDNRVTSCRARDLGISWQDVMNSYQNIPREK